MSRAKATHHTRPPQPHAGSQHQPPSRAAKDKGSKPAKPHGAKAGSAAAAAAKHGSVTPLPQTVEHLVAAIPVPHLGSAGEGEALREVNVVGYHFVHPLPSDIMAAVVQSLRSRPPPGFRVADWHRGDERTLLLLRADRAAAGAEAREAAEGDQPDASPVSAVVLHSYGGVSAFNAPDGWLVEVMRRLCDALVHSVAATGSPRQLRLSGRHDPLLLQLAEGRPWPADMTLQRVDESLCKEDQKILVNPGLASRPRWIKKDNANNLYHLQAWDATNLDSISQGVTKSAALRYYDMLYEMMLDSYDEVIPEQGGGQWAMLSARSLLRRRRRGKDRLAMLQQVVDKMTAMRTFLFCRLRVSEGPAGTWNSDRHYAVWEAMRDEYELESRLEILMGKADLLKQSCLDRVQANHSTFTKRSEQIIIALIATEIVISLTGLHGVLDLGHLQLLAKSAASALGAGGGSL